MAVRRLREAGAEVVVGTCPDLGAVQPVPQPLRCSPAGGHVTSPPPRPSPSSRPAAAPCPWRHARRGVLGRAESCSAGPVPPQSCRICAGRRGAPALGERRARPLRRADARPTRPNPGAGRASVPSPRQRRARWHTPAPRSLPPRSLVRPVGARAAGPCCSTASARPCRPPPTTRSRCRRLRALGRRSWARGRSRHTRRHRGPYAVPRGRACPLSRADLT